MITVFFRCQRGEESSEKRQEIALVMKTLNNPFFIDMKMGAEAAAKKAFDNIVKNIKNELKLDK